jgi:uncharacterized protein (TIGR02246 family)
MTSNSALPTADDSAVRAVLDAVYAAWAVNDADALVAPYAPDATAILPGSYLAGRDEIRAAMTEAFAGPLKGSRAGHEVQGIRFPDAGTAIVISQGAVVLGGEAAPRAESRGLETWVLSKDDGTWRVRAFHNCPQEAA